MSLCYCGSGLEFQDCCEPYILGVKKAPTAEAVMRSRFSAHCIGNLDWLDTTNHPDTKDEVDPAELEAWNRAAKWVSLEILSIHGGQENDESGEITFRANYTLNGMPQKLVEDSFFKKEGDTWYYVDGNVHKDEPAKKDPNKVGRNDPCSCGSGKKYKKCCGLNS